MAPESVCALALLTGLVRSGCQSPRTWPRWGSSDSREARKSLALVFGPRVRAEVVPFTDDVGCRTGVTTDARQFVKLNRILLPHGFRGDGPRLVA